MARLLIDDVTIVKTDQIHLHVRFRGGQTTSLTAPIPPMAGRPARPNPTRSPLLDRLLDDHTDAEAADHAQRRRSPLRRRPSPSPPGSCCTYAAATACPATLERLRARGLLTLTEIAERLDVHHIHRQALAPAGLLIGHKANDKNEQLFEPPTPGDPRLIKCMGRKLSNRVHIEPRGLSDCLCNRG